MKTLVKNAFSNKFYSSTLWVFLGTGFLNFGNYVYHLLMGRMLGVSLYGALESIISLLYILFVPILALSLTVVKFVSEHKGRNDVDASKELYNYLLSKLFIFGSITALIVILISPVVKSFLHINSTTSMILLSVTFLVNLFYILNKSVLQGMSSFLKFSILSFIETSGKVIFAIVFVLIGFKVEGAFAAISIGIIMALIVSQIYLERFADFKINFKADFREKKRLLKFAIPTFVTTLALTSMFTTDIVLVRHYFPAVDSGYYSALSVLGKIVFFAASPIVFVIFPMASESHARGEAYKKLLFQGFAATLAICSVITVLYFSFSELMVKLLFGVKFLPAAQDVGIFAVFISIYTLCSFLANFYLSVHKTSSSILVAIGAMAQIFAISFLHESLVQVIWVSTSICFALLISLLLYYPRAKSA